MWCRVLNDCDTPVSAMLKLSANGHMPFLLESVEGGVVRGRYSFIGRDPDLLWRARGDVAEINRAPALGEQGYIKEPCAPLASLRTLLAETTLQGDNLPQPLAAGLFGYLGYEFIRQFEKAVPAPHGPALLDHDALLLRPQLLVIVDQIESHFTLVAPCWAHGKQNADDAYRHATERLQAALRELQQPLPLETVREKSPTLPAPSSNMTEQQFVDIVTKAKEYIAAGDVFQVVLSQRLSVPFSHSALSLYRSIRRHDPSPFLFCFDFGGHAVVRSSPEILVRVRDGKITVRPIAGTRPRGMGNHTDAELAADLLADPKERAEHLMLVDLGRNDVGRVAKTGTVKVDALYTIEHYRHVMHLVSQVSGELRADADMLDALLAGFPAGTVSGAPKIRAMQIIEQLEPTARGLYAGCVGYFGANGNMDTCIAIRTALLKNNQLYVQAGAGIVHDSVPQSEYQETLAKARSLLRAAAAV